MGKLFRGHVHRREGAYVISELPAVAPIFVLRDAMHRQVAGLAWREVAVFFLHPGQRLFDGGISARLAAAHLPLIRDPIPHSLIDALHGPLGFEFRGTPPALHRTTPPDLFRDYAALSPGPIA